MSLLDHQSDAGVWECTYADLERCEVGEDLGDLHVGAIGVGSKCDVVPIEIGSCFDE